MLKTAFLMAVFAVPAAASDSLLFFESQLVAGSSSLSGGAEYYSMMPRDAMQKPSVGFDFIRRVSSENGDRAVIALQARLAYDAASPGKAQPQVYNAYVRGKFPFGDIWLGHDKPAFGLVSSLDTHGALLQTLAMEGFGSDRDWGMGFYRQYAAGDISVSLTAGSGMAFPRGGTGLASARVTYGVLGSDNYMAGAGFTSGRNADVLGTDVISARVYDTSMGELDFSYNMDNIELKAEADAGSVDSVASSAALLRLGFSFLEEGKLKAEFQPMYMKSAGQEDFKFYTGLSYSVTASLALRCLHAHDRMTGEKKLVGQAYYYKKI